MKIRYLIFLLLIFAGCSQKASRVKQFSWLVGTWVSIKDDTKTTETWMKSENDLTGENFVVVGTDTVFSESISITQEEDTVIYTTMVKGSTEGTDFKLIKGSNKEAVFENIFHDFPQKLIYRKIGKDSLYARIEGENEGKLVNEELFFARKK
jgi:hypothetical protein